MFNLKELGQYFTRHNLWERRIDSLNASEIEGICEAVHHATAPMACDMPPYINDNGELIVPKCSPVKYRWWNGGQSVKKTLVEIGASKDVIKRYCGGNHYDT